MKGMCNNNLFYEFFYLININTNFSNSSLKLYVFLFALYLDFLEK